MIQYILSLFRWLTFHKELHLVNSLLNCKNEGIKEAELAWLIHYIKTSEDFKWVRVGPRDYVSKGGGFTLCADIYGYEIKMRTGPLDLGFRGLIDCSPSDYGLTYEQGKALFNALADAKK